MCENLKTQKQDANVMILTYPFEKKYFLLHFTVLTAVYTIALTIVDNIFQSLLNHNFHNRLKHRQCHLNSSQ